MVLGETVPSSYPPSGFQPNSEKSAPQGPPPAYPSIIPLQHMQINPALLQQQLLQNPHFAQANANNNITGKSHTFINKLDILEI